MGKCQDCKHFFNRTICHASEEYLLDTSIACDEYEPQSLKNKIEYQNSTRKDIYTLLKNL